MKEKYAGYIPYDQAKFKRLWDDATFVVDSNILLNLYRYSKETQTKVLDSLAHLSDRLWIPFNTAQEYFNNRISVIKEQDNLYEELKKVINLSNVKQGIKGIRHLTLSSKKDELLSLIDSCQKHMNAIIDDDKSLASDFIKNDDVLKRIVELFDKKVGEAKDDTVIEALKKDIDKRYEAKIPPGYKDAKKNKEGRKYGDCLNWFEIINYAKKSNKDVIYVTDDAKEDWIYEFKGKKIGPREELLQEFYKKTDGKLIYIYNTTAFLTIFNEHFSVQHVSEMVIDEIKNTIEDQKNLRMHERNSFRENVELIVRNNNIAHNSGFDYITQRRLAILEYITEGGKQEYDSEALINLISAVFGVSNRTVRFIMSKLINDGFLLSKGDKLILVE